MTQISKRIQANVNKDVASQAELVMDKLGLNPTVVINALYKKIAATGGIPFSFKLTPDQMEDIRLQEALKSIPTKELKTQKDLEDFF